jgi:hypothetical protein
LGSIIWNFSKVLDIRVLCLNPVKEAKKTEIPLEELNVSEDSENPTEQELIVNEP